MFLVDKAHKLDKQDWSCRSANRLILTVVNKINEIVESPDKFLNHDFIMNIFADKRNQMTAFDEYMSYMFGDKQTSSMDNESKCVRLDQLVAKHFSYRKKKIRKRMV